MFQGQFLEESLNTATVLRKKKKKKCTVLSYMECQILQG